MRIATGWSKVAPLALLALVATAAPSLAAFTYVVGSGWQSVDFDILTPAPFGDGFGGTIDDPNDPFSPINSPWEFSLSSDGWLRITDVKDAGDYFRIWDNGIEIGLTNQVDFQMADPNNPPDEGDPDWAWGSDDYSHGLIYLAAGNHSLNFQDVVFEDGTFDNLPDWFEGVGQA